MAGREGPDKRVAGLDFRGIQTIEARDDTGVAVNQNRSIEGSILEPWTASADPAMVDRPPAQQPVFDYPWPKGKSFAVARGAW